MSPNQHFEEDASLASFARWLRAAQARCYLATRREPIAALPFLGLPGLRPPFPHKQASEHLKQGVEIGGVNARLAQQSGRDPMGT